MRPVIMAVLLTMTVLSCKEGASNGAGAKTGQDTTSTTSLQAGCYAYSDGKSTIRFEITQTGRQVLGNLTYALAEKDRNTGTFKGVLKDDILIGEYTFDAEGTTSTREVAFKLRGDKLVEGYGSMNEDGTAFKDREAIEFTSSMPLQRTDCTG